MHASDANRQLVARLVAGLAEPHDESAILACSQGMLSKAVWSVVNASRDRGHEPTLRDVLEVLSLAGRTGELDDA